MYLKRMTHVDAETFQTASHELRTPLSIMLAYANLLQRQCNDQANTQQKLALSKIIEYGKVLEKAIEENLIVVDTTVYQYSDSGMSTKS